MARSRSIIVFAAFALAMAVLSIQMGGCSRPASLQPLQLEVGVDLTPKDADTLFRKASQMPNYIKKFDFFTLRVLDNRTSLISTERPVSDAAAYTLLKETSRKMQPVTDLGQYFETVAAIAEKNGPPMVLVCYTDGLDDAKDYTVVSTHINAAAQRLARAKRLRRLIIGGTVRDTRTGWPDLAEMLDPVSSKLTILPNATLNPDDIDRLIKNVRATVLSESQKGGK